jgi:hypothetical protein
LTWAQNSTMFVNMKAGKKKKDKYTTNLRLPKDLADKVKKAADDSRRSMNGEIEFTLAEKYA